MASLSPPVCIFDLPAPDFALRDTEGRLWRRDEIAGPKGMLIMFICNHCPYVQAVMDRMVRDATALQALGIGVAAISSNDVVAYPQDDLPHMRELARERGFGFPYLFDENQDVAKAYGAICTPDFFGYNAAGGLQYRGRLDASGRQPGPPDARRDLFEAMRQVAETGHGPAGQVASIGCSIKWRA